MGYAVDIVKFALKLALYLAMTGQLVDATRTMMNKAYHAQSQMISLSAFNRSLVGK